MLQIPHKSKGKGRAYCHVYHPCKHVKKIIKQHNKIRWRTQLRLITINKLKKTILPQII